MRVRSSFVSARGVRSEARLERADDEGFRERDPRLRVLSRSLSRFRASSLSGTFPASSTEPLPSLWPCRGRLVYKASSRPGVRRQVNSSLHMYINNRQPYRSLSNVLRRPQT